MSMEKLDAAPLVPEYQVIVRESTPFQHGNIDWTKLHEGLVQTGEWSDSAASHLIDLARNYGSFMLRNAFALSVAANISDGDLGF